MTISARGDVLMSAALPWLVAPYTFALRAPPRSRSPRRSRSSRAGAPRPGGPRPSRSSAPPWHATASPSRGASGAPSRPGCPTPAVLVWADVVVLEVPDLASPLKARIGGESVTARQPGAITWAFALVARRAGKGEARARVRGVACERTADGGASPERCVPVSVEVRAEVVVGG